MSHLVVLAVMIRNSVDYETSELQWLDCLADHKGQDTTSSCYTGAMTVGIQSSNCFLNGLFYKGYTRSEDNTTPIPTYSASGY